MNIHPLQVRRFREVLDHLEDWEVWTHMPQEHSGPPLFPPPPMPFHTHEISWEELKFPDAENDTIRGVIHTERTGGPETWDFEPGIHKHRILTRTFHFDVLESAPNDADHTHPVWRNPNA